MAATLISLVNLIVSLVWIILVLNMLISFAPLEPWHPARQFLGKLADPILRPFRNIIPPVGMFDLSPIVALLVIQLVGQLLVILITNIF